MASTMGPPDPWALPRVTATTVRGHERDDHRRQHHAGSALDDSISESNALLVGRTSGGYSSGGSDANDDDGTGGTGADGRVAATSSSASVSATEWRTVIAVATCLFCINCQPSEAFLTE
jgi:hypothetical protein